MAQFRIYCCTGPHCTARGARDLYRQLENELWLRKLSGMIELQPGGCQDHCDYGPNMLIYPGPWRYAELTAERLIVIIERHLIGGEPLHSLLATPEMRRGAQ